MFQGELVAICLAERKRDDLRTVAQVEAVAGRGLAGDRYFVDEKAAGKHPDREVTLIEAEAIDAMKQESSLGLKPAQARRNLITRNVPLNHLVGRKFTVGAVVLRGLRLCEPCGHLEELTVKGVKDGLCHRGGLRAQIVAGGVLRAGDRIAPLADA